MFDRRAYAKQYHKDNKEKEKEYRKNNAEKRKIIKKKYYENNKEKVLKKNKQWKEKHPGYMKEYYKQWRKNNIEEKREYDKQYRIKNKDKLRIKQMNRRRTDLKCNLNHKISGSVLKALKRNKNGYPWETLVNYTLDDLIKHLKKTMPRGYGWKDYMEGRLHLDHIIPIKAFNYTKSEHSDFRRCWNLNNLRLLPAEKNWTKAGKISKPFQPSLQI